MALCAGNRQGEEYRPRNVDTFDGRLQLPRTDGVSVKGGSDTLFQGGIRRQVTGDLIGDKTVEREVLVECVDHPFPIGPHAAERVAFIATTVGVPGAVQPMPAPTLSVMRRRQQPIDAPCIGVRARVPLEGPHGVATRWQADQIKRYPPELCGAGCRGGRCKLCRLQATEDETVDRVAN